MLDLLKSLVEAMRDGIISPATVLWLLVLGLIAWFVTKGGEKALRNVSGLLTEGERLRATLSTQLDMAHARAAMLENARDDAMKAAAAAQAQIAQLGAQLESAQQRLRDLESDLEGAIRDLAAARLRLAQLPSA